MSVKVSNKKRSISDLWNGMGNSPKENDQVTKQELKASPIPRGGGAAALGVAGNILFPGSGDFLSSLFAGASPTPKKSVAKRIVNPKAAPPPPAAPTPDPSFLDYLAQASQLVGAPDMTAGIDFSGQESQARQTAGDASAKLQAMYNALHNNFQNDAPAIAQNFDAGTQAVGSNAAAATGDINNAYDAARQAQTAQLAALGIGDAAGVIAGKGESSTGDQAHAVANVIQNRDANQNQLAAGKTSSLNYNGQIANAALQQGTDSAAKIQQVLAQKLMDIQQQAEQARISSQGNYQSEIRQLAQDLFNSDMSTRKQNDANQLAAAKLQQSASSTRNSQAAAAQRSRNAAYTSIFNSLVRNGTDPQIAQQQAQKMANALG